MSNQQQMGDVFNARRAAARQQQQQQQQQQYPQQPQPQQRQQQQPHHRDKREHSSRWQQQHRQAPPQQQPRECSEGKVVSLLEAFGFIYCADRTEDIFFHYSEIARPDYRPEMGDEVRFEFAPVRGGRGGSGGGGGYGGAAEQQGGKKAPKAIRVEPLPPGTRIEWDVPRDPAGVRRRGRVLRLPPMSMGGASSRDRGGRGGGDQESSCGVLLLEAPESGSESVGGGGQKVGKDGGGEEEDSSGEKVYFTMDDLKGKRVRLGVKDLMEFTLVTNRRTKRPFARDMTLVQSEKERAALEREERLVASATSERGVVIRMKKDHGYLRSAAHSEPIYFHLSQVRGVVPNDENRDEDAPPVADAEGVVNPSEAENATGTGELLLSEGQAVQFLAVNEDAIDDAATPHTGRSSQRGHRGRWTARNVQPLTADSIVRPYHVIANGVTGVVVSLPKPCLADAGGRGGVGGGSLEDLPLKDFDFRGAYGAPGRIALHRPLHSASDAALSDAPAGATKGGHNATEIDQTKDEASTAVVAQVDFFPEDAPGGLRIISSGGFGGRRQHQQQQQQLGTWLQVGDVVLFDVVQEVAAAGVRGGEVRGDEESRTVRVRAHPPQAAVSKEDVGGSKPPSEKDTASEAGHPPGPPLGYISLVRLGLAGRAEGVISTLKMEAGYGFIRVADRPVDAYFRISDVLPPEVVSTMRDVSESVANEDVLGRPDRVLVGAEVSFDLSAGQQYHQQPEARENVKASRVALLAPPHSNKVMLYKVLARDVRARITKRHANGSGTVELLGPSGGGAGGEGKMDDAGEDNGAGTDVKQSQRHFTLYGMTTEERYPMVTELLDEIQSNIYGDSVVFPNAMPRHETQVVQSMAESRGMVVEFVGGGDEEMKTVTQEKRGGRIKIKKKPPSATESPVLANDTADAATACATTSAGIATTTDGGATAHEDSKENSNGGGRVPARPSKKSKKKMKPISLTIRFEKNNIVRQSSSLDSSKHGGGHRYVPHEGDIVICDVVQSRSTCQAEAVKVRVVERAKEAAADTYELGIVTEVVPARQFGFISTISLDPQQKQGAKFKERVFFHYNKVVKADKLLPDQHPLQKSESAVSTESSSANIAETPQLGSTEIVRATSSLSAGEANKEVICEEPMDKSSPAKTAARSAVIQKGDEVRCEITTSSKHGKRVAVNIVVLPPGTLPRVSLVDKTDKNSCQGYILIEPSHTSLANTPTHHSHGFSKNISGSGNPVGSGGRWEHVTIGKEDKPQKTTTINEDGRILLLSDPSSVFSRTSVSTSSDGKSKDSNSSSGLESAVSDSVNSSGEDKKVDDGIATNGKQSDAEASSVMPDGVASAGSDGPTVHTAAGTHLSYRNASVLHGGASATPRRGDLVSFGKAKGSSNKVKDVRVVQKGAAQLVRGHLEDIDLEGGGACFVADSAAGQDSCPSKLEFSLSEVVSCNPKLLKDKESVEGIVHEGAIYGVSRTVDIYLETKVGGRKERPRLNLTVRKELQGLGGKIMAQSGMAKGPDGTNGFAKGWTKRLSPWVTPFVLHSEESIEAKVEPDVVAEESNDGNDVVQEQ